MLQRLTILALASSAALAEQAVMPSFRASEDFDLTANPLSANWRGVPGVETSNDRYGKPVAGARTEIRSRWTGANLYFLFVSDFERMNLRSKPERITETFGIWENDVVEVFIGHDLERINRYKEFEVTPQEEWVDLDVDKDRQGRPTDWLWNSGMSARSFVDQERKRWYCEIRIPWTAIDPREIKAGNELRLNLYRIEGNNPDRKYIAWRPVGNPSYHTPKAFGRLRLQ
ncbi:MAG: carbohydrate-binding family 9-like protein [Bryobacteraceae bacterium]